MSTPDTSQTKPSHIAEKFWYSLMDSSFRDKQTGLHNKNYWADIRPQLEESTRFGYAVIFVDVNGLKATNDALGHDKGDILINNSASFLTTIFRKEDEIIRIGGDEFIVIIRVAPKDLDEQYAHFLDTTSDRKGPRPSKESFLTMQIEGRISMAMDLSDNPPPISYGSSVSLPEKNMKHDLTKTVKVAEDNMYIMKKSLGADR